MTRLKTAAALIFIAATLPDAASAADPRFKNRPYVKNEIVTLAGKPGIESAVAFAPDERIENIAVGNSGKWDVNPNKRANVIFFKPTTARARTNMTVITDQRTYLFDLVSSDAGSPVYMLQFTYPDVPKPARAAVPASTSGNVVALAASASAPALQKPAPAKLNFEWRASGEKRLLPVNCFDDGSSTFLHWQKDVTLPAILVRGYDGTEGPVNYTVKDDYVVVEGVPAQIILRSGRQRAALTPLRRPASPTETAAAETLKLRANGERIDR